jgi:hypothetical protein
MNFIKSETHVCPDQVLIYKGWTPESLLVVSVCPALFKYSTTLSHIRLIRYTFPHTLQ